MKWNFDGIRMVTVTVGEVERYNLFDGLRLYLTKVQGHDARPRRDFFSHTYTVIDKNIVFLDLHCLISSFVLQ